jgi:hypothetical protein
MTFDHLPPLSLWREHEEAHRAFWREHEEGHQAFYAEPAQPPKPTRPRKRKPTLAGVSRHAARAGIEVARYEVRPDGTIGVVVGKPVGASDVDSDDTTSPDRSEWH